MNGERSLHTSLDMSIKLAVSGKLHPLDRFLLIARISAMHKKNITKEYLAYKNSLGLKQRYYDMFEYRNGLTDGNWHTLKETGQRFGISGGRVRQIEGRVIYEVEKSHVTQRPLPNRSGLSVMDFHHGYLLL